MTDEEARNVDLDEEAKRLKKEAADLREKRGTDVDSTADALPDADEKIEKSVETLRRLARR